MSNSKEEKRKSAWKKIISNEVLYKDYIKEESVLQRQKLEEWRRNRIRDEKELETPVDIFMQERI